MAKTKQNIAEALYEVITGMNGFRSAQHSEWEKQAKEYIKKLTNNKNITLTDNEIIIQTSDGTRTLHTITIK